MSILLEVVVASVLACMMINDFIIYMNPNTRERELRAVQRRCQLSDWQNGLIFFFGCFGTGGSGDGSKPWQRAVIAQSRNLPTNPCLWLSLWRCMSLLDVSCQLALGTIPSSWSTVWIQTVWDDAGDVKPLQCLSRYTVINPQSRN